MSSRVVLVHGFTQTGASWAPVVPALEAAGLEVAAPDAPGHGSRRDVRADLWTAARLLVTEGGRAAYVGYSMGGRVALHAALAFPDEIERLVLVGATAGIDDPAERAARRQADERLGFELQRVGVAAFLEQWLANPLFATLPREAAGLEARRANTVEGLVTSLRLMGTGAQEPLWPRLAALAMPVLVVAGERDDKFRALGRRLVESIGGNAGLALVPGAGHACHLEQPVAFCDLVVPFLRGERDHV